MAKAKRESERQHAMTKQAFTTALRKGFYGMLGAPIRGAGSAVRSAVIGKPTAGRPWWAARKRSPGVINRNQYDRLKARAAKGEKNVPQVSKTKGPDGETVYLKERFRPGGVVGAVINKPVETLGIGLIGAGLLGQSKTKYDSRLPAAQSQEPVQLPVKWG